MKKLFPEYFLNDGETLADFFKNYKIILDTNILLNFYKYSEKASSEYLTLLTRMKNRIWIPNRVIDEFFYKREEIIKEQANTYLKMKESISKIITDLEVTTNHPFVAKSTLEKFREYSEIVITELQDKSRQYKQKKNINNDPYVKKFITIFKDHIGQSYSDEQTEKIITESKERFEKNIPPGFRDFAEKKVDENATLYNRSRRYGDLIIWFQILDYAEENKCNVLFITNDMKNDWVINKKETRIELVREFKSRTENKLFKIIQLSDLPHIAKTFLNIEIQISKESTDELRNFETNYNVANNTVKSHIQTSKNQKRTLGGMRRLLEGRLDINNINEISDLEYSRIRERLQLVDHFSSQFKDLQKKKNNILESISDLQSGFTSQNFNSSDRDMLDAEISQYYNELEYNQKEIDRLNRMIEMAVIKD